MTRKGKPNGDYVRLDLRPTHGDDLKKYLTIMASSEGISITKYIQNLIYADKEQNEDEYDSILETLETGNLDNLPSQSRNWIQSQLDRYESALVDEFGEYAENETEKAIEIAKEAFFQNYTPSEDENEDEAWERQEEIELERIEQELEAEKTDYFREKLDQYKNELIHEVYGLEY